MLIYNEEDRRDHLNLDLGLLYECLTISVLLVGAWKVGSTRVGTSVLNMDNKTFQELGAQIDMDLGCLENSVSPSGSPVRLNQGCSLESRKIEPPVYETGKPLCDTRRTLFLLCQPVRDD